MALTASRVAELEMAITSYAFPPIYFDFRTGVEVRARQMKAVEDAIREMLTSKTNGQVLDGLTNVIYWGYAQIGYRDTRVRRFRRDVTADQLDRFRVMLDSPDA